MPLASAVLLAPHFAASELGADKPDIPDSAVANLRETAGWLEGARAVLGVPLRITRGWDNPVDNAAVGGVADSEHLTGYGADFVPEGLGKLEAYQKLTAARAAGQLLPFDELIFYALDDHIHVGVRPSLRGNLQLETVEGGVKRYLVLTDQVAEQFWGSLPVGSGDGPRGPCGR